MTVRGMIDGLPVGLMLAGKHFDEPTIYRAAYAFEHEHVVGTRGAGFQR
jgi:Asp-tRNA(Asn)/Glu-tRNA(Gln) amidotransferase A subunit family amidase